MKVKINIELWDDTTAEQLEELGITEKFLKTCYISSFEELMKTARAKGMEYSLNVEVENNTGN